MHIDARHRSSIYQKLLPILGDDDANALMTAFPSLESDELVTRQFLRAELAELRAELRGELAELRGELFGVRDGLRGELFGVRDGLRGEMAAMETRLTVRIGAAMAAQTSVLLAAFAVFS